MSDCDPCTRRISGTNLLVYIATSHPSLRDNASTAIVERTTLFTFDESSTTFCYH